MNDEQTPASGPALAAAQAELRRARHQVRNELQLLTSLIALHVRRVDEPHARRELVRCYRRVGVVGVVHQLTADSGGTVQADACLRTVADFISASARTLDPRDACELSLKLDLQPLRWRHEHAARIALIVDELVGNAMDHALPYSEREELELQLVAVNHRARLSLRDYGPGLPPDFDPATCDTLGLPMAVAVAQQLGGELELQTLSEGGTLASLWLPLGPGDAS